MARFRQGQDVIVVGAGIGGLAAALRLASRGVRVTVVDKAKDVGGKMRTVDVRGHTVDAGPTVLTMRHVFDELFIEAGLTLSDWVSLVPLRTLARHAWPDGSRLDLYADPERNAEAIREFAGSANAEGYRRFLEHTRKIHDAVEGPFMRSAGVSMFRAAWSAGPRGLLALLDVDWRRTLWEALSTFFDDPRLQQLFGRYATYYGSSPFQAPATLGLIAHVEQCGVWRVRGGMQRLATALGLALRHLGGTFLPEHEVSEVIVERGRATGVILRNGARLEASAVIVNAEPAAIARGQFGRAVAHAVPKPQSSRSLSAMTFCVLTRTEGLPLEWHNVFFGPDYRREFDDVFERSQLPREPTVYVCAPEPAHPEPDGSRPLFLLVNAPATGDQADFTPEVERCLHDALTTLQRGGLILSHSASYLMRSGRTTVATPNDFARLFPASGGALYGPATHSPFAAFGRPGPRTKIRSLYLVGGAAHPGAGVPMVALGGRAAASLLLRDHPSIHRFRPTDTPGGISMPSATTENMR